MEPPKVEKFSTTDRGNGLRALAPLRPGELLFRSDPLAYTVCKGSRGVVCDRCLLGYVRSALAHLSPSTLGSGVLGARACVCEGGSPSRGSTGARRCPAPHFSSRAVSSRGLVAADRIRAAVARAAAPGVVGVPGSVPAAPWGGAGPADTYPPWAAVGTGGSQRERRKGKRWGTKSVSCATSFTGAAVEITVGQGDGGWDRNGINQSRS